MCFYAYDAFLYAHFYHRAPHEQGKYVANACGSLKKRWKNLFSLHASSATRVLHKKFSFKRSERKFRSKMMEIEFPLGKNVFAKSESKKLN